MKKLFLLLMLLALNAHAENVPLPPSIPSINDIVGGFRNVLTTKIGELGKNFIPQLSDKTIVFTDNAPLRCNGETAPQGSPVSRLQYNFKITGQEMVEKAIYAGCNNQISLIEDVVIRGTTLKPLKYDDFIKGKREFDLQGGETYKLYRLSNSENDEIFKILIEKKENLKLVQFYILGQPFLRLNYEFKENSTRLTLTYTGYIGLYVRKHARWEFQSRFEPIMNSVLVTKAAIAEVSYFDMKGALISQNNFLNNFNYYITDRAIARIRNIVDYHNYYFPTTKVVQTGSGNERLKEELRIAFNRLQNNTELNLVKKQIQDYMDAVENGLINDSRPK